MAQVKFADLGTRVFYTAHNGFDTHGTQLAVHAQLWRDVSEAVAAFFADLRTHEAADDVIMLLWSEFGRRVRDNGQQTMAPAASPSCSVMWSRVACTENIPRSAMAT